MFLGAILLSIRGGCSFVSSCGRGPLYFIQGVSFNHEQMSVAFSNQRKVAGYMQKVGF